MSTENTPDGHEIDLVCLGVGRGSTHVLRGKPSTAFALCVGQHPKLVVDCGAGIARSCLEHLRTIPLMIYVSHNHMDHTGDLPIVLQTLRAYGKKPQILGHPDVLKIVRQHRLHEIPAEVVEWADWVVPDDRGWIDLGGGLSLRPFRSIHSYLCYGFELSREGELVFAYSGDSAFGKGVHGRIVRAPVAVADGRRQANHDHASFEEIDALGRAHPSCSLLVVHYEESSHTFESGNVRFLKTGERLRLWPVAS